MTALAGRIRATARARLRAGPGRAGVRTIAAFVIATGTLGLPRPGWSETGAPAPYRVVLPPGPGPHPALLFVSGCSGFAPDVAPNHYPREAEAFAAQGFAVVFVDYLGARGRKTCGGVIRVRDIASDILTAADYVGSRPFIRSSDISVIGWSMGGGGVLAAIGKLPAGRPAPFRRAIAYYPVCWGVDTPWPTKVPLLMLLAGRDELSSTPLCQELVGRLGEQPIEVHVYPDARHAFDVPDLPPFTRLPNGAPIGQDSPSAAAAREEVRRFLAR
jgi:dienelactone hydrolase